MPLWPKGLSLETGELLTSQDQETDGVNLKPCPAHAFSLPEAPGCVATYHLTFLLFSRHREFPAPLLLGWKSHFTLESLIGYTKRSESENTDNDSQESSPQGDRYWSWPFPPWPEDLCVWSVPSWHNVSGQYHTQPDHWECEELLLHKSRSVRLPTGQHIASSCLTLQDVSGLFLPLCAFLPLSDHHFAWCGESRHTAWHILPRSPAEMATVLLQYPTPGVQVHLALRS